jgi:hypothetical protein
MHVDAPPRRVPVVFGPPEPGDPSTLVRIRRVALVAALLALLPVAISYLGAVRERSNSPLGIRTVEWLRNNGAADIVAKVESVYYTLTAPSKGGPTLRALPRVGYGAAVVAHTAAAAAAAAASEYRPPRVHAILHPALPGEGVWHATRPAFNGPAPVLETTLRDQPEYPRVLAGVAWIDTHRVEITLNPGRLEPSVSLPRGEAEVPQGRRARLLATFNSGFKLADSGGGVVLGGRTYARMVDGQATLVGYRNGRVDVVAWRHGSIAPAGVSFARQNLPLIVDRAKPTPNLNSGEWGATLGNAVLVWRSAVGVDRRGNLIYVAGEDQSVESLAKALIRAGAVRGMELDINSFWVSLITYGAAGAREPRNLLPSMNRAASRYLEPDDRDFFAVYAR